MTDTIEDCTQEEVNDFIKILPREKRSLIGSLFVKDGRSVAPLNGYNSTDDSSYMCRATHGGHEYNIYRINVSKVLPLNTPAKDAKFRISIIDEWGVGQVDSTILSDYRKVFSGFKEKVEARKAREAKEKETVQQTEAKSAHEVSVSPAEIPAEQLVKPHQPLNAAPVSLESPPSKTDASKSAAPTSSERKRRTDDGTSEALAAKNQTLSSGEPLNSPPLQMSPSLPLTKSPASEERHDASERRIDATAEEEKLQSDIPTNDPTQNASLIPSDVIAESPDAVLAQLPGTEGILDGDIPPKSKSPASSKQAPPETVSADPELVRLGQKLSAIRSSLNLDEQRSSKAGSQKRSDTHTNKDSKHVAEEESLSTDKATSKPPKQKKGKNTPATAAVPELVSSPGVAKPKEKSFDRPKPTAKNTNTIQPTVPSHIVARRHVRQAPLTSAAPTGSALAIPSIKREERETHYSDPTASSQGRQREKHLVTPLPPLPPLSKPREHNLSQKRAPSRLPAAAIRDMNAKRREIRRQNLNDYAKMKDWEKFVLIFLASADGDTRGNIAHAFTAGTENPIEILSGHEGRNSSSAISRFHAEMSRWQNLSEQQKLEAWGKALDVLTNIQNDSPNKVVVSAWNFINASIYIDPLSDNDPLRTVSQSLSDAIANQLKADQFYNGITRDSISDLHKAREKYIVTAAAWKTTVSGIREKWRALDLQHRISFLADLVQKLPENEQKIHKRELFYLQKSHEFGAPIEERAEALLNRIHTYTLSQRAQNLKNALELALEEATQALNNGTVEQAKQIMEDAEKLKAQLLDATTQYYRQSQTKTRKELAILRDLKPTYERMAAIQDRLALAIAKPNEAQPYQERAARLRAELSPLLSDSSKANPIVMQPTSDRSGLDTPAHATPRKFVSHGHLPLSHLPPPLSHAEDTPGTDQRGKSASFPVLELREHNPNAHAAPTVDLLHISETGKADSPGAQGDSLLFYRRLQKVSAKTAKKVAAQFISNLQKHVQKMQELSAVYKEGDQKRSADGNTPLRSYLSEKQKSKNKSKPPKDMKIAEAEASEKHYAWAEVKFIRNDTTHFNLEHQNPTQSIACELSEPPPPDDKEKAKDASHPAKFSVRFNTPNPDPSTIARGLEIGHDFARHFGQDQYIARIRNFSHNPREALRAYIGMRLLGMDKESVEFDVNTKFAVETRFPGFKDNLSDAVIAKLKAEIKQSREGGTFVDPIDALIKQLQTQATIRQAGPHTPSSPA